MGCTISKECKVAPGLGSTWVFASEKGRCTEFRPGMANDFGKGHTHLAHLKLIGKFDHIS